MRVLHIVKTSDGAAWAALQVSDYGYVLETGDLAIEGPSASLAVDARVAATYLGQAAT